MSGKRREPSGGHQERGQSTRMKEDVVSIRENTLRLLRAGARASMAPEVAAVHPGGNSHDRHMSARSQDHDSIQTVFVTNPSQGVVDIANPARLADGAGHAANGAGHAANGNASMDIEMEDDRCGECGERRETFCAHCSDELCCGRARFCDSCQGPFCARCSVTNYDERYDRTFCLECNADELRKASENQASFREHQAQRPGDPSHDRKGWT